MKKIKQVKNSGLLLEILNTVVCEKHDLVWTVAYSTKLHKQVVKELLSQLAVSEN